MARPKTICVDLFEAARPPRCHDLYDDVSAVGACVYDALCTLALRRWIGRDNVIDLAKVMRRERTRGKHPMTYENASRTIRGRVAGGSEVGARLARHGWLVLAHDGRVCLAPDGEVEQMTAKLRGGE